MSLRPTLVLVMLHIAWGRVKIKLGVGKVDNNKRKVNEENLALWEEWIGSNLNIVDLLESHGSVVRSKSISCPFHGSDSRPSFYVDVSNNVYKCFGCHRHGGYITLYREFAIVAGKYRDYSETVEAIIKDRIKEGKELPALPRDIFLSTAMLSSGNLMSGYPSAKSVDLDKEFDITLKSMQRQPIDKINSSIDTVRTLRQMSDDDAIRFFIQLQKGVSTSTLTGGINLVKDSNKAEEDLDDLLRG